MNEVQCLILTTAHHRDDARLNRHLDTLDRRGVSTLLIADRPGSPWRRLLFAPFLTWRHLRSVKPQAVLLPDPELYVAGTLVARLLRVRAIIDVHEDYAAAAADRDWVPGFLRPLLASLATILVALGRRVAHATVVAADHLRRPGDLVVPNIPATRWFPTSTPAGARPAAVYVGDITVSRGAHEMVGLLALVPDLHLELIGSITDDFRAELLNLARNSADRLLLTGRLPYQEAWQRAAGATAGLSLLRDTPAYRLAVPTKVWEYMAVGLPVIASSLPSQRQLLEETKSGVVVESVQQAAEVLTSWLGDRDEAVLFGRNGRQAYETRIRGDRGEASLAEAVLG